MLEIALAALRHVPERARGFLGGGCGDDGTANESGDAGDNDHAPKEGRDSPVADGPPDVVRADQNVIDAYLGVPHED